ncbi:RNA polymerase subunit sigma-54 [Natronohydrobacter thiooxidans]|uniref:RNA polymerase factor sigma-54 n=1 Tax=Natronohydrobacter thiooxidans TaxID=87172 RepID=UPI0008FF1BE6|nr:RNA polymerase subunit sigma-54 [Natronohydrobacter thiooxidans]
MSLSTRLTLRQSQVFRLGQVTTVLQMSGEQLDEHLLQTARDNPFLVVRRRSGMAPRAGNAQDLPDTGMAAEPSGLYEHVLRELAGLIAHGGPMERLVMALIEALEPTGWLGCPVDEIARQLGLEPHLVENGLRLVQRRVSPAGLFARDLRDCLQLQLEDQGHLDEEMRCVLGNLGLLQRGGPGALASTTGLTPETVSRQLARLRRLDPKPGSRFSTDPTLMREPDVRVEKQGSGWVAVLRSSLETRISRHAGAAERISPEMRQALAQARAIKQAVDLRHNALQQIMQVVLAVQGDFFRDGAQALLPLSLSAIAEKTGFHLSTVSRVLNGLLVEGPSGIISARELCPHAAAQACADGPSKPRVMARLRKALAHENARSPMSDQRLSDLLRAEGLSVSRRVVARYRQELGFSGAAERRRQS